MDGERHVLEKRAHLQRQGRLTDELADPAPDGDDAQQLFGVGVGSVAFAYDGSHPVNLLALLGVLVGMPLCLLLLTLVFLLPVRIPGLASVREAVSVLNPGRWAGAWLDRFSGLTLYGGFSDGQSGFARWQLVVFSQWLACGFFVGVLSVGWMLVAVTDLAFGWSTTLRVAVGS